jgi:TM2 domain-containing membrane protein YozV
MAMSVSQRGIKQLKRLLKEGLYWEALNLPPSSSMREVVLRIAELRQSCQGDQEALALLSEARQDLQSGRYPSDRELCDGFFEGLGNGFQQSTLNEVIITREHIWRECIRQKPNPQSELSKTMLSLGGDLATNVQDGLQSERIELAAARQAAHKSIHALEIAQIYAEDPKYVLDLRAKLGSSLYCNLGVERVNRAQNNFKSVVDSSLREIATGDADVLLSRLNNAFDIAAFEIREGIEDIEKALGFDSQEPTVRQRLKEGKELLDSITRDRDRVMELVGKKTAAFYCNRGVERINRAQRSLQAAMETTQLRSSSGRFDQESLLQLLIPGIQQLRALVISEVEAGIADIEEAKRLDPHNQHINDQLKTARQILENVGGRVEELSSKTETAKPQHRASTPSARQSRIQEGASPKRKKVALLLAVFLGWLGADRFYLGRESAVLKLSLFLVCLMSIRGVIQVAEFVGWACMLASLVWWLVDIALIARGQLKDRKGYYPS